MSGADASVKLRILRAPMSETDDLLINAAAYAEAFAANELPRAPARGLAVVTCMDARMDIFGLLGLQPGDAHVIRNAGGVISDDALRSLVISQRTQGTEEIVLIHHTDCGMLQFSDEELARALEAETGARPEWPVHAFEDPDRSVRESIARILESPFIRSKHSVRGFVFDNRTGELREVGG
jgi:carbonic anhydrase